MSAISEKVRTALYAAMNVSGVTTLATGGIHYKVAPETAEYPFVTFTRIPVDVHYAMANNLVGERDLWQIKALTRKGNHASLSPPALAEDILTAVETAIGTTLTLSGNTVRRVRRVSEIPDYIEDLTDGPVFHHGFNLEVFTE